MTPPSRSIAFVCPRFAEGSTVGGAETLLKQMALRLKTAGHEITFLTTCASDHFTWKNDIEPGEKNIDGLSVIRFPVDEGRDIGAFLDVQDRISRGCDVTEDEELTWLRNNVNSSALCEYIKNTGATFDRIIMGPYLFGLIYHASLVMPEKTMLVPCLHDESFAYLKSFKKMFTSARSIMFNSEPERKLAEDLYNIDITKTAVVGMGMTPFSSDSQAFSLKYKINEPYVIYSGRREGLKGTPMLLDYVNAFRKRTGRVIKLVLTGSGQIEPPTELIPHIIDLGFVSEKEKHDAMAGALAFCHPSAYESFGIVALEAWLAGTTCLVNARSEVLKFHCSKSNGGLWFRNYPEFEEELLFILQNENIRKNMGQNGKNYVIREYSWETVEGKLTSALDI